MSTSSDISSLFKLFGGRSAQYQEFSEEQDECAPPGRRADPGKDEARQSAPASSVDQQAASLLSAQEPAAECAPVAPLCASATAWAGKSLPGMLSKLAQAARGERVDGWPALAQVRRPQLSHLKIIAVISAKGGVGKSTVAANLAVAMQRQGEAVLAVELDPQNALCHHLGVAVAPGPAAASAGIAQCVDEAALRDSCQDSALGVSILPYGSVDEGQRRAFERRLEQEPDWLARRLSELQLAAGTLVVLDTPPGPSIYLQQALSLANLALVVSLPDAASYATLPKIESLIDSHAGERREFLGAAYVINQVDPARQLSRDITQIMRGVLGDQVIGMIHWDQSIAEALAYNRSVLDCDPFGQGSHDIQACSQALLARLAATERREQSA
ncbi:cellulose biosynthesis protein BcsQ [Pseudomonas sp. MBLB4136]|uniref:cellulose biosynthesis protein BcsQ n=1 Tax=Pseudomonas sp. MBLB4136 TaxID=3451558 RepID=UPI003F74BA21